MKKYGYSNKDTVFFKKTADKLIVVSFTVGKTQLYTYIDYKKYSYDDLFWKLLSKEELSSKRINERVFGAFHVSTTRWKEFVDNYTDNENDEQLITARLNEVCKEEEKIASTDYNNLILSGDYSARSKCIALLDSNRINDAVQLAQEMNSKGEDGGLTYYNKTFFQLVLEKYSNETFNVNEKETIHAYNHNTSSTVLDKVEWHVDSACEMNIKRNIYFDDEQEDLIVIAGAHIAYFLAWLVLNNGVSEQMTSDVPELLQSIKMREESPNRLLIEYCDEQLLENDINANIVESVKTYYNSHYYNDYSDFLDEINLDLFEKGFSWENYDLIETIINEHYLI